MDRVTLPNGRTTSRLGFGCASLRGGTDAAESRALISAALEAGIRHFDVAPSYGLGMAEDIVGEMLAPLRDECTITTKAGVGRPAAPGLLTGLRRIVRPALGAVPGLWKFAAPRVRRAASVRQRFDEAFIARSVAESLKRLRTGSVDILMMHEMRDGDGSPELLALLGRLVEENVAGVVGTAVSGFEYPPAVPRLGELGRVRQFGWTVFDPPLDAEPGILLITHGAIGSAIDRIPGLLNAEPGRTTDWSGLLDLDLADPAVVADLLLAAAVAENRDGLILYASKDSARIRRAARVAGDQDLIARGRRFRELVQGAVRPVHEGASPPIGHAVGTGWGS